jgi:superoxide reductase
MDHETRNSPIITRRSILAGGASVALITGISFAPTPVRAGDYGKADLGLFGGINRVKDPANMSGLAKKHAPSIQAPTGAKMGQTVAVAVRVGAVIHPMGEAHWIQGVRLFTDTGQPLADVTFARTGVVPVCEVHLVAEETTTLIAQSVCNLHGLWEARHTVKV